MLRPAAGGEVARWVTPPPVPATLEVAAPSHGQVRVSGLARFFPAHTVHARRSTAVVTANNCDLYSIDHYHVHRVSVSLEPLLTRGSPGHSALQGLLKDRTDSGIARFQRSMRRLANPPEHREAQVSVPVQDDPRTLVTSSTAVQQGDGSQMNVKTHYVIEETELPIIDLLARDRSLVRSLAAAVDEPERGPAARKFLRDALQSAGCTDDLALLDHSADPRTAGASIFWLFGVDVVDRASAVMVGSGNRLRTDMRVDRGRLSPGTVLADLDRVRQHAARARNPQVAHTERAVRYGGAPTLPDRSGRTPANMTRKRDGRLGGAPGRGGR